MSDSESNGEPVRKAPRKEKSSNTTLGDDSAGQGGAGRRGKPPRVPPPMVRAESNVDGYLGALRKEELEENTLSRVQAKEGETGTSSGVKKLGRGILRFQQLVEKERRWTRSKAANFGDLQFRGKCIEILCQKPEQRSNEDIDALLHFLFDNDFMLKFEQEQRRRIARIARWEIFKKEQIVFHQGDEGDKFYILLSGGVSVWIKNAEIEKKGEEVTKSLRERAEEQYGVVDDAPTVQVVEDVEEQREKDEAANGRMATRGRSARARSRSALSARSISPSPSKENLSVRSPSRSRISRESTDLLDTPTGAGGSDSRAESVASMRDDIANGDQRRDSEDGPGAGDDGGADGESVLEDPMPGFTRVADLSPGDSFGELALLKSKPRAATILTEEATSFIVVSKSDFQDTLKSHHEGKLDAKVEFLRTVPALRHNSGPAITALSAFFTEVTLSRNTPILEEGCDKEEIQFYLIKSGSCRVSFDLKLNMSEKRAMAQAALASNANRLMRLQSHLDGGGVSKDELQRAFQRTGKSKKVVDLALLEQGQHFGAIPILNGEDACYSVTSATVVELLVMSKQNFLKHTTQTDRSVIRKTAQLQHDAWLERIEHLSGSKEEEAERLREEQRRKEASERLVTKYTQQVRRSRAGQGKTRRHSAGSFLKLPPVIPGVQPCKTTDELIAGVKLRLPHVFPAGFDELIQEHHRNVLEAGRDGSRQSEQVKSAAREASRSCVAVGKTTRSPHGKVDEPATSFVTEVPGDQGDAAAEDEGAGEEGEKGKKGGKEEGAPADPTSAHSSRPGSTSQEAPVPPLPLPPNTTNSNGSNTVRGRKGGRNAALTSRSLGLERTQKERDPEFMKEGDPGFLSSRGLQGVPHPRRRKAQPPDYGYEDRPGQHPAPPQSLALVPFAGIHLSDERAYDPMARADPTALNQSLPARHYPNTQFPMRGLSAMDTTFYEPYLGRNPTRTRVAVLAAGRSHLKHRRYSRRYDTIGVAT